jgi:ubiquinone/menaquinone biosynthesis C-methylase UbiE
LGLPAKVLDSDVPVAIEKGLTVLTTEEYHRRELKIALDPEHPEHVLPPAPPAGAKVLDIGCGAGQTLIAAFPDRVCYGLDIDQEALRLGRSLTDRVRFVRGQGEQLPYASESFDMVLARVSLPYMRLDPSLREMRRVLRSGGAVWITLHTFRSAWQQARESSFKGWLFFAYIVVNSMLLHLTQKQFAMFGRNETFQTEHAIRRLLARNGFGDIQISLGEHFVVTAHAR